MNVGRDAGRWYRAQHRICGSHDVEVGESEEEDDCRGDGIVVVPSDHLRPTGNAVTFWFHVVLGQSIGLAIERSVRGEHCNEDFSPVFTASFCRNSLQRTPKMSPALTMTGTVTNASASHGRRDDDESSSSTAKRSTTNAQSDAKSISARPVYSHSCRGGLISRQSRLAAAGWSLTISSCPLFESGSRNVMTSETRKSTTARAKTPAQVTTNASWNLFVPTTVSVLVIASSFDEKPAQYAPKCRACDVNCWRCVGVLCGAKGWRLMRMRLPSMKWWSLTLSLFDGAFTNRNPHSYVTD